MEKLFLYLDIFTFDFLFSVDVPITEQNKVRLISWFDYYFLDLTFEEIVDCKIILYEVIEDAMPYQWLVRHHRVYPSFWNLARLDFFFNGWVYYWHPFIKRTYDCYVMFIFLWFPLFLSIMVMINYVHDLFSNIYFGRRFLIEKRSKNFFYWNYCNLWNFYWIIFIVYPRWNNSFFLKLPNPNYIFRSFVSYFERLNKWVLYLHYLIIILIYVLLTYGCFYVLTFHFYLWFLPYYTITLTIYFKVKQRSELYLQRSFGLNLKYFLLKLKKWTSGERLFFSGPTFFLNRYSMLPFYGPIIQFLLVSAYLVRIYMDMFFQKICLWDGYFYQTLTQFYFFSDFTFNMDYYYDNPGKTFLPNGDHHAIFFDYWIGVDGINIWMVWLTYLLVILCVLFLWENQKNDFFFSQIGWIFLLLFASVQFFCMISYFWMYIFFELSLLPIFVLVVYWGSNRRKVHAAYQMVLFTFIGSIFLLGSIFLIYFKLKTFNLLDVVDTMNNWNIAMCFTNFERKIIWLFMFAGFAVKTPLYPFHIWLPEAHSEAPTAGSVLLAGVLLKMGTYGFMWYVIPTFPDLIDFYKTLLFSMCICGVLLSSLAALAQTDIKKIIAYSSIGHMGLVILGLSTLNQPGLIGGCFMMLSHGLISSALFFCIGLLYKIYGTRSVLHYSAIAHFMPKFAICFYVFILANMGFPGTAGFPAEVLIFSSVVGENFFITILMGLGSVIGGTYSIWLLTRILYGQINSNFTLYWDLKPIERKVVGILAILVIFFGVFSYLILDFFKPYCSFFEIKCIFPKIYF